MAASASMTGEVNLYPANGQTKITVRTEVIAVLKHYGIV